jgi:endonuclease YncB( thermonuclease family)
MHCSDENKAKGNLGSLGCPHQTDEEGCQHPVNELGICAHGLCPVTVEITHAGRRALRKRTRRRVGKCMSKALGTLLALNVLTALVWAAPPTTREQLPSAWLGRAQWDRQFDGDTFWVTVPGRDPVKIRLAWVDAPELGQPWGPAAAEFVRRQVKGNVTIWVIKPRGYYGRPLVAVILPDGRWLNHELARYGLAWVKCRANCPRARRLADQARAQGRGLWGGAAPVDPAAFRRQRRQGK